MIPETPETRKKPAPCGSQSSRSSSLCRGARLLLSTPTQFAPVRNGLSSVGFDPIFGCTARMHKWVDCWLRPCGASTRNMSWGGMKLHVQFVWKHVVILHRFATFCYCHEFTECVKKIPTSLKGERPRWVSVYILGRCAFSRNLENWCLPICNLRWSPWILEALLPKCIDVLWRCNFFGWAGQKNVTWEVPQVWGSLCENISKR